MGALLAPLAAALTLSLGCVNEPEADSSNDDNSDNTESSSTSGTTGDEDSSSSSESATSSDDSDTTGGEDGNPFIDSDLPPPVPTCDFWGQDCLEGEKCTPVPFMSSAWDTHLCAPAGTQPPGSNCSMVENGGPGEDTCDATSMCYDIDPDTGMGTCVELCTGTPENSACNITGNKCWQLNQGILNVCLESCNPLNSGECPPGQSCVAGYVGDALNGFLCFPPVEQGISGESCDCANCCADGHMCTDAGSYGPGCAYDLCCTEMCDLNEDTTCTGSGQICVALFEANDPLYANVGSCMIPM